MRNNLCLPKVLFGKETVCTQGWPFIISIQILRLAKLWKRVENSCKQPGQEVLRDYLTGISTTDFKQPFHLSFSLSPEVWLEQAHLRKKCLLKGSLQVTYLSSNFATSTSGQRELHLCCDLMDQEEAGA